MFFLLIVIVQFQWGFSLSIQTSHKSNSC